MKLVVWNTAPQRSLDGVIDLRMYEMVHLKKYAGQKVYRDTSTYESPASDIIYPTMYVAGYYATIYFRESV